MQAGQAGQAGQTRQIRPAGIAVQRGQAGGTGLCCYHNDADSAAIMAAAITRPNYSKN